MNIEGAKARTRRRAPLAGSALALLAFMAPKTISAAPQTLDCVLTDIEIKSLGTKFETQVGAEKRAITVTFDDNSKALTLKQDGVDTPLGKVAISQTSMTAAGANISIGIDRSSWHIVFQTYEQESTRSEFGECSLRGRSGSFTNRVAKKVPLSSFQRRYQQLVLQAFQIAFEFDNRAARIGRSALPVKDLPPNRHLSPVAVARNASAISYDLRDSFCGELSTVAFLDSGQIHGRLIPICGEPVPFSGRSMATQTMLFVKLRSSYGECQLSLGEGSLNLVPSSHIQ